MTGGGHAIAADEWRRHGLVLIPCVAGMMLLAVHAAVLGVMIPSLEKEFGWSRAQISAGFLIPSLGSLVLAPLIGSAVDRLGARPLALFGVPFYCLALGLLALVGESIVAWWALYGLLGLAVVCIFPNVWAAAISRRFHRNRGMALAVALAGTGISSAILPAAAAMLIASQGWRGAYATIALICFLVVFPLVLLFFKAEENALPKVPGARSTLQGPRGPMPWHEVRSPSFIRLAAAIVVFSVCASILTINVVPILLGEGFVLMQAAKIAGLVGVGTILGRLTGGFFLDRYDGRFVALATCAAPMLGIGTLLATQNSTPGAMFACFTMGLASGAEYDAAAYLAGRHFSIKHFGFLFGIIASLTVISSAIAPVISNAVYDITGTYDRVLLGMIPALVVAGLLFLALGPYPRHPDDVERHPKQELA